jgi:hypothetical protein
MIQRIKLKFLMRVKYLFHLTLFYIYKFDSWHISSIESRQYCLDIVDYINGSIKTEDIVVEIGCGLGETISGIDCSNKYGYDQSNQVIKAAKLINRNNYPTIFKVGSFEAPIGLEIKYLITVNFLHDFDENQVSQWFKLITDNNNVLNIVVDEIDNDDYYRLHRFNSIIPKKYKEIQTIIKENYTFGRSVKVFSLGS